MQDRRLAAPDVPPVTAAEAAAGGINVIIASDKM